MQSSSIRVFVPAVLVLSVFVALAHAANQYSNLALNPNDVQDKNWTASKGYPHATSNSEYPSSNGEYDARNAIDGKTANAVETQNPAWGPDKVPSPWWRVAFAKTVQIDSVVIWIRADWNTTAPVPHDSYWKSATLVFSDSSKVNITIDSTAKAQGYKFTSRATNSLTIANLVAHDPNWRGWCALAEVQAWGYDTPSSISSPRNLSAVSQPKHNATRCITLVYSSAHFSVPANVSGVELFTMQGKKVWSSPTPNGDFSVAKSIDKGVYRIRYISK